MWLKINLMEERDQLPSIPAVYAVYFDNDLVYIGSSNNIRNRFSGHAFRYVYARNVVTPWQTIDDTVEIILKFRPTRKIGEWLMREIRLIQRLKPLFNSHHKGRAK